MTIEDWLRKLVAEGFSFRKTWEAKTGTRHERIACYTIYGPTGLLLTSAVLRQARFGVRENDELFVFWIAETLDAAKDFDHLRALNARVAARTIAMQKGVQA